MIYHPWYHYHNRALRGAPMAGFAAAPHTVWLCGGHPSILPQAEAINADLRPKATLNNTALLINADLAFLLDPPDYYDPRVLWNARPMRISRMNYVDTPVAGMPWCRHPSTRFLSDIGKPEGDWLNDGPIAWFGNSFMGAVQVLYRLGFRTILLAGCKFGDAGAYAYGARADLIDKNAELYAKQVRWLRENLAYFARNGLTIKNATPGNATDFLEQVQIDSR